MASLENIKKIMESSGTDNFLKLVADVLFEDIENISEFKTYDMYYVDDIVLIPASITGADKDKLYICNRNGVRGTYQARDWRVFTLVQSTTHGYLESKRYTSTADNTSTIKLGVEISLDKHQLTLTHSVRGYLKEGIDWKLSDRDTITFIGLTLFEGEYVDIDFYE